MLLHLPQDILLCVVNEWIGVGLTDLTKLDVATCNRNLRDGHWLTLLADVRIKEGRLPIDSISSSLDWISSRRVRIAKLTANLVAMGRLLPAAHTFPATTAIAFEPKLGDHRFGTKAFLTMLPALSEVDFSSCSFLADRHLADMLAAPLPHLTKLKLFGCMLVTSAAIAAVVCHCSSTLEELVCDKLEADGIRQVAEHCRSMKRIRCSLGYLYTKDSSCLLEFCTCNPSLVFVSFASRSTRRHPMLTNDFMESLAAVCPQLQEVCFGPNDPATYTILTMLLERCADLRVVEVRGAHIEFNRTFAGGERYANVGWTTTFDPDDDADEYILLKNTLSVLTHLSSLPIHQVGYKKEARPVHINKAILLYLADTFGHELREVWLLLDGDIDREDLLYVLSKCPKLICLRLWSAAGNRSILEDDDIVLLPQQCSCLVDVQLVDCAWSITDNAVIDALKRFGDRDMANLNFEGCTLLTDAVLDAIDELFPNVRAVGVWDTAVTKERSLDFLLKNRFGSSLTRFTASSVEAQDWIQAMLAERGIRIPRVTFLRVVEDIE